MSSSERLSKTRASTVINQLSSVQEKELMEALGNTIQRLENKYPQYSFLHKKQLPLTDIIGQIHDYETEKVLPKSHIKPDGGFLYVVSQEKSYPIVISEVKKQGVNKARIASGNKPQARGNAIERLGKNVIGIEKYCRTYGIMPFVAFCYGDDFEDGSYIRDRVTTIAKFSKLNEIHVLPTVSGELLGSFYLDEYKKSVDEMETILYEICLQSITYYENSNLL